MAAERPAGGGQWHPTPAPAPKPPATAPSGGQSGGSGGGSAGAAPLGAAGGTPTSKYVWAMSLIQAMGGTPTPPLVNLIIAWINGEGTSASWNPLATTDRASGSTGFNSVGVQNFTSMEQGIQTTIRTLTNGRYPNIVAAIKSGDPNYALNHPQEFDTWGTGGQRMISLYRQVSGDKNAGAGALIAAGGGGGAQAAGVSAVQQYILENDPSLDWALGVPELQAIIAAADVSTPQGLANLDAKLKASDYYRSHSASMRDWTQLQSTDPLTAQRNLQGEEAWLKAQAANLGLTLSDSALAGLALSAMQMGWQQGGAEEHQALLAASAFSGSGTLGAVGDGATQARQLFAQYGIKLDDQTAQQYGLQINTATDKATALENLRPTAIAQAKGLFPSLTELLDKGVTVQNVFAPYQQAAASLLEVDPSTIDLTDPKWNRSLQGDQKQGAMSLDQWQSTIMTDPRYRWDTTGNARASAVRLTESLGNAFGVSTGGGTSF